MKRSESIKELATALAKAQGEMDGAKKDAVNPFFKARYADLASVIDAIREPMSRNGLSHMQFPRVIVQEDGKLVEVETLIMHTSGEFVSEILALPIVKYDPQELGKLITYCKRYGLQAALGVPSEDDDGNAANDRGQKKEAEKNGRDIKTDALAILRPAAAKGTVYLEAAWKNITQEQRTLCKAELPGLKEQAQKVTEIERQPGEEADAAA